MNINNVNKSMLRGFGSALVNLAMVASPFATGAATNAYYANRRGSYGRNNSYLANDAIAVLNANSRADKKAKPGKHVNEAVTSELFIAKNVAIRELIIVDEHIKDHSLFSKLNKPGVEVIRIANELNGFDKLLTQLGQYKGLESIHLFSHQFKGQLLLGNQMLTQETLENSIKGLNVNGSIIAEGGELLTYNCELESVAEHNAHLEIVNGDINTYVKDRTKTYAADALLSIEKGDINASPEENSIARKRVFDDFAFTGTIQFDQVKTAGDYFGGASINAEFWASASMNYTLVADGLTGGTGAYTLTGLYNDAGVFTKVGETGLKLHFDSNETFSVTSLKLAHYTGSSRSFTFTSNLGPMKTTLSYVTGSQETVSFSSNNTGINYINITSGDGNFYAHVSALVVSSVASADTTNPTFNSAGSTPNDNATGVATANNIVVDFDEDIAAGTGNVTVRDVTGASDFQVFAITGATATSSPVAGAIGILNDKLYINPTNALSESNNYSIRIDATAIDDTSGNSFAGITDDVTFNFTTADETSPTFNSAGSTPTDNATGIATANDIVVDFSENIAAGTGNVTVRNVTGSSNFQVFDITGATATSSPSAGAIGILNDKLYINPTNALSEQNNYSIRIDATAIDDASGNSFAGITDDVTFNFTTADETNPTLTNQALAQTAPDALQITYRSTETGTLYYVVTTNSSTPTQAQIKAGNDQSGTSTNVVSSNSAAVTVTGADQTVNLTSLTLATTTYHVFLYQEDASSNESSVVTNSAAADVTLPVVSTSSPDDDDTGVDPSANITVTFSENIAFGTGNIQLKQTSDDVVLFTIDANDPSATSNVASISGKVLTINPGSDLSTSTGYYLSIPATAIDDLSGNSFAGITNTTDLNFVTVVPNSAPAFTIGANQTVSQSGGAQTVSSHSSGMTDNDGNTQTLTFNVANNNNGIFDVQPDIDESSGNLTFTPKSSTFGKATVTVSLSDDGGVLNGGVNQSADQTFDIFITPDNIKINEVHPAAAADAEFIEVYNTGASATSLSGLVMVWFNGGTDQSYKDFDLSGSTSASGFYVIGETAFASKDQDWGSTSLQNGPDAVAIYVGSASDFTNGDAPTTDGLVDVIVYGSSDDAALRTALGGPSLQVAGNAGNSISRSPDGTGTYVAQAPSAQATNDVTPPINPVVSTPGSVITVNSASQTISGTHSENGVTVHAYADANNDGTADNSTSLGSATVASNAWSFSVSLSADAANNFVVKAEDSAGNESSDVDVPTITEDSTSPANPVVSTPGSVITVNAASQTISGTHTEDGVTVHAYADANNDGVADNATSLGSATVSSNSWSFSVSLTADAANNFVVKAEDSAGNESSDVDVPTITEDSTSPANPVVSTPGSVITVNAASQTISGTHSENGVNVHAYADANNDGTADNSTSLGSATVASNAWSFSVSLTADAANNFVVKAEDAAGNESSIVDVPTITEDSTSPANPSVTTPGNTISVNAATATISGTHTENGVTVHAYADANNDGTADNSTSLGSATVASNAWSFSVSLTADAANNFVVKGEDSAGNESSNVDVPTITEDSTNPTLTATSPADDATDVGISRNITLTFSENIAFGTGNIQIIDLGDNSSTITIDAASPGAEASISGSVLTLSPSSSLELNTNYAVQIAATAIDDLVGNSYAGFSDNTTFNFTTINTSIEFSTTSSNGAESTNSADLTVALNAVSGVTVTVDWAVTGTATGSGTDYTLADGTLTINAGDPSGTITIAGIADDALDEFDETVIVTLSSPVNAGLGTNSVHTYTINDNDATPVVSLSQSNSTFAEGAGINTITATSSATSGKGDIIVSIAAKAGGTTATVTDDYTLSSGTITITQGSTTGTANLTAVQDAIDEPNETITVEVTGVTNADEDGTQEVASSITDDDATPTVAFSAVSSNGAETTSSANLQVDLSAVSGQDVTVNYSITGTATGSGTDYTLADGTLTFTAGSSSENITIASIIGDALDEDDETVIVTLSNPGNAALGTNTSHTYTILDDDASPTIAFTSTSSNGAESASSANLQVALSAVSGRDVTVNYAVTGTAIGSGTDYTLADGTLTMSAGNTSNNITIAGILDDTLDELDETVIVTLSSPNNAVLGTNQVHTYTITDNDATPTVAFSTSSSNGAESVSSASLQVDLSAVSGQTVTVDYAVSGTATGAGTDYTLADGTLTINAGNSNNNVTIATIVDDVLDEENETVIVTLSNPVNAILGTNAVHTYTITDNDDAPTVTLSADNNTIAENGGTSTLTATLSVVSSKDVTVTLGYTGTAINGTDYNSSAGTSIVITAGTTSNTASPIVTSSDDTTPEGNETIVVDITNVTNGTESGTQTQTITISDDDTPNMTFTSAASNGAESVSSAGITVDLNMASSLTVTANYTVTGTAANGTDFALADGTVTFNPGSTRETITIASIVDDAILEANETVILSLSNLSNANAGTNQVYTYTINDNDAAAVTIADVSGAENGGNMTLIATLDNAVEGGFTVDVNTADGTATTADSDYTSVTSQTLTFAGTAGETQTFTVTPTSDTKVEGNETVSAVMSNLAATTLSVDISDGGTLTINNDDDATVTIADVTGSESGAITVTATLDNPVQGGFTVDVNTTNGTATAANDYTAITSQTLTFAGTAGETQTFTVTPIDDAVGESEESLTVSMDNLVTALSASLTITDQATVTIEDDDDNIAPAGYSIGFDDVLIGGVETATTKATFAAAEVGATYAYSVSSSNGGTAVTGTGTIATMTDQITLGDLTDLNDGTLTISVTLTDPSGNVGAAQTATTSLDTTAPIAPVVSGISADSGESSTDGLTNDNAISIIGTAEANATVEVLIGGTKIGTTTANGSGAWTFDHSGTTLTDGAYSITAKATDAAGNTGVVSAALAINVDTSAPKVTLTTTATSLENGAFEVTISFDEEVNGFSLEDLSLTNATGSELTATIAKQVWTITITPSLDGEVSIEVQAAVANDNAGNGNAASNSITTTFDGTAPMITAITRTDDDQLNNNVSDADFTVLFSEEVSGVDATDFEVVTTGTATGAVKTVTMVDGKTYTVNVNGISGQGTVQLNAKDDDSITDNASNSLAAAATGEAYSINWVPTDLAISVLTIAENNAVGDAVGTFSTTDQDAGDAHTYSLVSGTGDAENASFTISGGQLLAAESFDFEAQDSYSIRVRSSDDFGGFFDKQFTITIENVLEPSIFVTGDGQFDETILGFSDTKTWVITNNGEVPIEVRIASSTPDFTIQPGSIVVPTSETREVTAVFTPSEAKVYNGAINFAYDGGTETELVSGIGVIVTDVDDVIIDGNAFKFYPNPAMDRLTIDLSGLRGVPVDVRITDTNGRSLMNKADVSQAILEVDVSSYTQGIYIIRVSNEVSSVNKKVIIKK